MLYIEIINSIQLNSFDIEHQNNIFYIKHENREYLMKT